MLLNGRNCILYAKDCSPKDAKKHSKLVPIISPNQIPLMWADSDNNCVAIGKPGVSHDTCLR